MDGTGREGLYRACGLCPRMCGCDRVSARGFCGMGTAPRIARAAPHLWEEPCIAGTDGKGTGAVFFSGCTLKCAYCQNRALSHDNFGAEVDTKRLSGIFAELEARGVHSLDLVTGTMFIPSILDALDLRRPGVPVVWNTSGYERTETLKMLEGYVQVYLPDLKHVSARLSSLCAGAGDYFRHASAALLEMRRQVGENVYDENGLLKRGMVVRHLVLPGCTSDAREVLRFLASELKGVPVSIMSQYTPIPECRIPGMDRRVTDREYRRVLEWAGELGIAGYSQERTSAEREYTPDFNLEGVEASRQPGGLFAEGEREAETQ